MLSERLVRIARSFGARAQHYDLHAGLQKDCARVLADYLPVCAAPRVLEIGCGTGFVTEYLTAHYPDGIFLITDAAAEMVEQCAHKVKGPHVSFAVMDGQTVPEGQRYDVIVIGMAAQWFDDPVATLERLRHNLTAGGCLIYSVPGEACFADWKALLAERGLQDGLLEYPQWPGVVRRDRHDIDYGRIEKFLKNLKDIGAHQPRVGSMALHPAALRQACRIYNQRHGGRVTWEIIYGVLYAAA